MKLSDAMRLGAMLRPQTFHYWFHSGGSCAIGAALEAVGIAKYPDCYFPKHLKAPKTWEWTRISVECPANCGIFDQVQGHLRHLNNDHRWTSEAIADWVSTIEPQEPVEVRDAAQGRESLPVLSLAAVTEAK